MQTVIFKSNIPNWFSRYSIWHQNEELLIKLVFPRCCFIYLSSLFVSLATSIGFPGSVVSTCSWSDVGWSPCSSGPAACRTKTLLPSSRSSTVCCLLQKLPSWESSVCFSHHKNIISRSKNPLVLNGNEKNLCCLNHRPFGDGIISWKHLAGNSNNRFFSCQFTNYFVLFCQFVSLPTIIKQKLSGPDVWCQNLYFEC